MKIDNMILEATSHNFEYAHRSRQMQSSMACQARVACKSRRTQTPTGPIDKKWLADAINRDNKTPPPDGTFVKRRWHNINGKAQWRSYKEFVEPYKKDDTTEDNEDMSENSGSSDKAVASIGSIHSSTTSVLPNSSSSGGNPSSNDSGSDTGLYEGDKKLVDDEVKKEEDELTKQATEVEALPKANKADKTHHHHHRPADSIRVPESSESSEELPRKLKRKHDFKKQDGDKKKKKVTSTSPDESSSPSNQAADCEQLNEKKNAVKVEKNIAEHLHQQHMQHQAQRKQRLEQKSQDMQAPVNGGQRDATSKELPLNSSRKHQRFGELRSESKEPDDISVKSDTHDRPPTLIIMDEPLRSAPPTSRNGSGAAPIPRQFHCSGSMSDAGYYRTLPPALWQQHQTLLRQLNPMLIPPRMPQPTNAKFNDPAFIKHKDLMQMNLRNLFEQINKSKRTSGFRQSCQIGVPMNFYQCEYPYSPNIERMILENCLNRAADIQMTLNALVIPVPQAYHYDANFKPLSEQSILNSHEWRKMFMQTAIEQMSVLLAEKRVFGQILMSHVMPNDMSKLPPLDGLRYIEAFTFQTICPNNLTRCNYTMEHFVFGLRAIFVACWRLRNYFLRQQQNEKLQRATIVELSQPPSTSGLSSASTNMGSSGSGGSGNEQRFDLQPRSFLASESSSNSSFNDSGSGGDSKVSKGI